MRAPNLQRPPATRSTAPVTYVASGPSSQTIAGAISSGSPGRPSGISGVMRCRPARVAAGRVDPGVHDPRRDGVDADRVGRKLLRESHRQRLDPRLRGRVVDVLVRRAERRGRRGDVDDRAAAAAAAGRHHLRGEPRAEHGAEQVDVDDVADRRDVGIREIADPAAGPGVVDEPRHACRAHRRPRRTAPRHPARGSRRRGSRRSAHRQPWRRRPPLRPRARRRGSRPRRRGRRARARAPSPPRYPCFRRSRS